MSLLIYDYKISGFRSYCFLSGLLMCLFRNVVQKKNMNWNLKLFNETDNPILWKIYDEWLNNKAAAFNCGLLNNKYYLFTCIKTKVFIYLN